METRSNKKIRALEALRNTVLIIVLTLIPLHCTSGAACDLEHTSRTTYCSEYDEIEDCVFRTARVLDLNSSQLSTGYSSSSAQQPNILDLNMTPTPCRNRPQQDEEAQLSEAIVKVEVSGEKQDIPVNEFNFHVLLDGEFKRVRFELLGHKIRLYLEKESLPFVDISHRAIPNRETYQQERRLLWRNVMFSIWREGLDVYLIFARFNKPRMLQNNPIDRSLSVTNPVNRECNSYNQRKIFLNILGAYALNGTPVENRTLTSNNHPFTLWFYLEDGMVMVREERRRRPYNCNNTRTLK